MGPRILLLTLTLCLGCGGDPKSDPTGAQGATDGADSSDGTDGSDGSEGADSSDGSDGDSANPQPPYGEDLVQDGGFEDPSLSAWSLPEGCMTRSGTDWLSPPEGAAFLSGLPGNEVQDCNASQIIDLAAWDFDAAAIDAGAVAVDLEGWLAGSDVSGSFDDQIRLQVGFLDATGQLLGSLETLVGAGDAWALRGATGLLPAGTRQLDLRVWGRHRELPDNDSYADAIALRLRAVTAVSPGLTLAPLLQDFRTDAMRMAWETDGNLCWHGVQVADEGGSLVDSGVPVHTIAVDEQHYVHIAAPDGLSPGGAYDYRVASGDTVGDTETFRTAPAEDAPVRIAWLADNQEGYTRFRTHLEHLSARAPDLLFVPGDLVQDHFALNQWREWWWGSLVDTQAFGSRTPVLAARGNHDLHDPYAYAYVLLPGNELFYAFRYGPVFVVSLDSQIQPAHMPEPIDQRAFLEAALDSEEARSADFRVVAFHQAPYTNSVQNDTTGNQGARDNWVPVFVEKNVDMVIAGHFHSYQRGELDGVSYAIVGGGGSALLVDRYDFWDHMTILEQTWHYATMDVEDGRLHWQVWDLEDRLIDEMTLER